MKQGIASLDLELHRSLVIVITYLSNEQKNIDFSNFAFSSSNFSNLNSSSGG